MFRSVYKILYSATNNKASGWVVAEEGGARYTSTPVTLSLTDPHTRAIWHTITLYKGDTSAGVEILINPLF